MRPPAGGAARRPVNASTRRNLWIIAGLLVVVALVAHHNITSGEIIVFCCIVPSIILHEVSHGYVANLFGDDTAKRAGRLTLNPVKHVDPVGTLIVPALLSLSTYGVFGWAKPVPVNTARLRSPRNQGVLVSLAGPATNAFLAAIGAVVFAPYPAESVNYLRSRLPEHYELFREQNFLCSQNNDRTNLSEHQKLKELPECRCCCSLSPT